MSVSCYHPSVILSQQKKNRYDNKFQQPEVSDNPNIQTRIAEQRAVFDSSMNFATEENYPPDLEL